MTATAIQGRRGVGLRDDALPFLEAALDVARAAPAVAASWHTAFGTPVELTDGAVTYVRYKPGTSLVVGYRFAGRGPDAPAVIMGYGKMVPADRTAESYARAGVASDRRSDAHVFWCEPLSLVFHVFPFDREIHGLRHLMNRNRMKRVARAAIRWESPAIRVSGKRTSLTLRRYKPERRVVIAADLGCVDETTGAMTRLRSHVKAYADDTGARVVQATEPLVACADADAPIIPAVLGYDADARILFQEDVAGRPLLDDGEDAAFARAGRALAWLHAQPRLEAGDQVHSIARGVSDVRALAAYVSHLNDRALDGAIGRLVRTLDERAPSAIPSCTVHGDFHHHQVLVAGDRVALVDLDEIGAGDPRIDVGNFAAHATLAALAAPAAAARLASGVAAFLAAYRVAAPHATESLGWFTALGLARLAAVPFRGVHPDWRAEIARILSAAEEALV